MTVTETRLQRTSIDPTAAGVIVVLCALWGLNQVSVKVANAGLQPVFQAGLRSLLGGLLVLGWCRLRGVSLFKNDGTLPAGIIAGLLFGAEFIFVYLGIDYTSVSRGIVFIYTAPFVVAIGAHFLIPGDRLTPVRWLGLVAAFAGVVLVFSDKLSLPSPSAYFGDALCLIAAVLWGATTLVIKTTALARASAEKVLFYQLAVSTVMMLAFAPLFGPFIRDFTPLVAGAFLYQVVVVVAASYLVWFWLIVHYPASRLAAFTFLTPVFAVILGNLLLSEPLSPKLVIALVLVATGITLVNRRTT